MGRIASSEDLEWRVLADATCAGLTPLIPLPLVDLAFEAVFRRRIPGAIARARGARLDPTAAAELRRSGTSLLSLRGCVRLPLVVLLAFLKRLWRKLVYILAIADATEQLGVYWHRAWLVDHMVRAGHLAPGTDVSRALAAFRRALDEASTSALRGVARQLIGHSDHVLRTLVRARRGRAAAVTDDQATFVRRSWPSVREALEATVARYDELYRSGVG